MNILIVGLGSIAQKHITALRTVSQSCIIYALRSSNPSSEMEEIINVYSLGELNSVSIDFAIISNPTSEHKDTILSLLSLQCPLFIEKPLYHKLDIEDVMNKVRQSNLLTYVACNLRFLDCLKYVKDRIVKDRKRINEVNVYCGSYLPEWRSRDFRSSYSTVPSLGGGAHLDLIHELDYLYWMFGMPSKVHSVLKNNSSLAIEAIDYASYCLEYDTFCANVVLNYYRRDYKRTFEIVFEDETWLVDLARNEITCNNDSMIIFSSKQKVIDTYLEQMKYFIDLLDSGILISNNSVYKLMMF